jgi:hypothetical protein
MINTGQGKGSKDGAPMELFTPAEGALEPITWLLEHLTSIALVEKNAFSDFSGPRGCRTHIALAEHLRDNSCPTSTDVRNVFESLMSLPPPTMVPRRSSPSRPKRTLFPRLPLRPRPNAWSWRVPPATFLGTSRNSPGIYTCRGERVRALGTLRRRERRRPPSSSHSHSSKRVTPPVVCRN